MRLAKSLTVEADIKEYVDETKGDRSASERVNELLRRAMVQEQYERLEAEAAEFFGDTKVDRQRPRHFRRHRFGHLAGINGGGSVELVSQTG